MLNLSVLHKHIVLNLRCLNDTWLPMSPFVQLCFNGMCLPTILSIGTVCPSGHVSDTNCFGDEHIPAIIIMQESYLCSEFAHTNRKHILSGKKLQGCA